MIGHASVWDEALLNLPVRMTALVDWSTGRGQPWQPLTVVSGSHKCDATSQIRWHCDGVFKKNVKVGQDGINAKGCRMRVRQEISALGFGSLIIPAGVYSITGLTDGEYTISLSGDSFETECIDSTFPVARTLPTRSKMTLRQQAELLITEAVPDATFIWDDNLLSSAEMPDMQVDSDRWGAVDGGKGDASILTSMGGEAFCNSFGAFQMVKVPSLKDSVVGTVKRGETMVTPSVTQDRQGVFNLVVVSGTPANGATPIGPVFVWDNDPTSDTYAGPDPVNHPELAGDFGVKPYRYDSPLITNDKQAKTAGQGILSQGLGVHEVATVDARYNPFYEAGDVVAIENDRGVLVPRLLDTVTVTWGAAKMTMATRSPKEDLS